MLELIAGGALLLVSPSFIVRTITALTQDEIAEDPRDLIANGLRRAAGHLSIPTEHFMTLYLLVHGVIKVGLVAALLRRRLAAYPLAIVVFAGLVGYQLYRYTITHGLGLLALTGFDLLVIALIGLEYRSLRRERRA